MSILTRFYHIASRTLLAASVLFSTLPARADYNPIPTTLQVGSQVGTNYGISTKSYSNVSVTAAGSTISYSGLYSVFPGMTVTDSLGYLPTGTTVISVASNVNSAVLSNNASTTASNDVLTFYYPWQLNLLPHVNATGQMITDLKLCYPGGNSGYGGTEAELAANPTTVQSAIEYPLGGVQTNVTFDNPGTVQPGDVLCGHAMGLEIPAGATYYTRVLVQVTQGTFQTFPTNRFTVNGVAPVMLGGSVVPNVSGPNSPTPVRSSITAAQANSGAVALTFSAPPNITSGMYISPAAIGNIGDFAAGAHVNGTVTSTIPITPAMTGTLANQQIVNFTTYQPFAYPSVAVASSNPTITFASCPVGVGPGFFVTSTSGLPFLDQVQSCTGGVMTLAYPATGAIPTTQAVTFSGFNITGVVNLYNEISILANVASKSLSFFVDGDSEVGTPASFTVPVTSTGVSGTCTGNQSVIPVSTTYGTQVQLNANPLPVGWYIYSYGGTVVTPFNNFPITQPTQIVGVVPNTSITVSPCPTSTVPSGTTMIWGSASFDANNDTGYIEAGLQGAPVTGFERSGDLYGSGGWLNNRSMRTQVWGQKGFTHAISGMCDNDIAGNTGATALPYLQSTFQNMATAYTVRGMKVFKLTCVPRTNTSVGEPLWVVPTVTAGGTGYAASSTFTATAAGGTLSTALASGFTPTPSTFTCTTNSSGVVTGCVPLSIGYYSVAPPLANNPLTGGAGSGLTVTLAAYVGWLDTLSQYSYGPAFQPTVFTAATSAVTANPVVPVASLTNAGGIAGTIASNMYLSTLSGAPPNTIVLSVSGNNVTLSNPVTLTNGAALQFISLRTAFNDWIKTNPPGYTGDIDQAAIIESGTDTGLWKGTYSIDGLHSAPIGMFQIANMLQADITNGTFNPF